MWHYVEGLRNWDPIWANHGIRILPGPSSLWLDATGQRLPAPYFPGFDTLGTLRAPAYHRLRLLVVRAHPEDHREGVRAVGLRAEPRPHRQGRQAAAVAACGQGAPGPVEAFKEHGADFVVADDLDRAGRRDERASGDEPLIDEAELRDADRGARPRDRQRRSPRTRRSRAIRGARRYRGDKLIRVATPHKLLDPRHGPLIAVRLHILTRKTLGGLETDLDGRCLGADGAPVPGLYAAGEVTGFGGGGMNGYNALEGTFLGGCLFSGRVAGRAAAAAVR